MGVWIGPVNVSESACADDEYLLSDSQTKLQSMLGIAEHYGTMYDVTYGASKTKITVIGSAIDMNYYSELSPWKLNGNTVSVTTDNEHLGQIVSGIEQEQKNVELRITKGRGCLFSLLGPAFQFKCLLSPVLKFHIFRTYISPILKSGLSTFALRANHLHSLNIFHRKVLRGVLSLSKNSNIVPLYFLLGELPIEGQLHRDVFSLFYNVWCNPDSKIYTIVKYLLQSSSIKSRTWSVFVRHLSQKYGLDDPSECLRADPPSKASYKELILTKISAHYEAELRQKALTNTRMKFLNVSIMSLRGRRHLALSNIVTSHEVKKSRSHIKMLCGDFFTYEEKAKQSGGSPHCRLCPVHKNIKEDIPHILISCEAYYETRGRLLKQYENLLERNLSNINFAEISSKTDILCQFILDPTSMNLERRINEIDPILPEIFQLSRDYCFAISNERTKLLKALTKQ